MCAGGGGMEADGASAEAAATPLERPGSDAVLAHRERGEEGRDPAGLVEFEEGARAGRITPLALLHRRGHLPLPSFFSPFLPPFLPGVVGDCASGDEGRC